MKRIVLALCSLLLVGSFLRVNAQDEAAMKNYQEYMTPGEMHKMMASWSGSWIGEVSMWMQPAGEPMKNISTAQVSMALNGLYQIANHKGSFNGMSFEGMGILAFDNHKKVFESTWIDNMGSGIMHLQGPWDPAMRSITFKGKIIDPGTRKETNVREVFRIIDDNTQVMEMYGPAPDGKEFKTMEIKYSRTK